MIHRYRVIWPGTGETHIWELRDVTDLAVALRIVCGCDRDRSSRLGVPSIESL